MKKLFVLVLFSFFLVTPSWADLIGDIDPPDTGIYWAGSDQNPSLFSQLNNANEDTVEAWLEALLGLDYNDSSVNLIDRKSAGSDGIGLDDKGLVGYDPGFTWTYAVVKYGEYWAAYDDGGTPDLLTTGPLAFGVSNVTFFNGGDGNGNGNGTKVPEPGTLFLLGIGLVSVAGFSSRRWKKN